MKKLTRISEEQNKKLEIICTIALIIFAIISFCFSKFYHTSADISTRDIKIFVGNQEITEANGQKISINNNMTFTIGDDIIGYNIIEIKNKTIRCIEADCPDKICINHGILREDIDNDIIICAPHKLTITYE